MNTLPPLPTPLAALATGLLLALATGCLGLRPAPDTTRFYTLNGNPAPPTNAPAPAAGALTLYVGPVELAQYLQQPGLPLRLTETEVVFLDGHQWAEPLRDGIHRTLQQDLAAVPVAHPIHPSLHRRPRGPFLEVQITVTRFELTRDHQAALSARWHILQSPGGSTLGAGQTVTQEPFAPPATNYSEAVQALGRCLQTLTRDIAHALASE